MKKPAESHMARLTGEARENDQVFLAYREMNMAQCIRSANNLDDATELLVGFLCNIQEGTVHKLEAELAATKAELAFLKLPSVWEVTKESAKRAFKEYFLPVTWAYSHIRKLLCRKQN